MLRQGPIPAFVHGVIEYLAGALFILAPFLFGFQSTAATAVSIVVGVLLFVLAATTRGATGLVDQIPPSAHVAVDFVLAVGLVIVPFVFGFSDEYGATAFFIILGILHLLISIGTRFDAPEQPGDAGTVGPGAAGGAAGREPARSAETRRETPRR